MLLKDIIIYGMKELKPVLIRLGTVRYVFKGPHLGYRRKHILKCIKEDKEYEDDRIGSRLSCRCFPQYRRPTRLKYKYFEMGETLKNRSDYYQIK